MKRGQCFLVSFSAVVFYDPMMQLSVVYSVKIIRSKQPNSCCFYSKEEVAFMYSSFPMLGVDVSVTDTPNLIPTLPMSGLP